ncbi:MAG: ChaN family lipoprotein [Burkholderiaceae bacterium]|nr:ChaN family lipoprotein [Burkholderiaceae bacterium]
MRALPDSTWLGRGLTFSLTLSLALALVACAHTSAPNLPATRWDAFASADVVLLGEQHDAPDHHAIEREAVEQFAASGRLAALALEMADQGRDTRQLPPSATEGDVREALQWNARGWPWARYGPTVMAAVRAGVPVLGANLPRTGLGPAMGDAALDGLLPPNALAVQRQAIRDGHCNLLPESQIGPMTRVQIARDRAMATTLVAAVQPGRTVLLVAGAAHVDRELGVPRHLPAILRVQAVKLQAGAPDPRAGAFDAVWPTPALPARDHCAGVKPPG